MSGEFSTTADSFDSTKSEYSDAPPRLSSLTTLALAVAVPVFGLFRGGNSRSAVEALQVIIFLSLLIFGISLLRVRRLQEIAESLTRSFRVLALFGVAFALLLVFQIVPMPLPVLDLLSAQAAALYRHAPSSFGHFSLDVSQTIRQGSWLLALFSLALWFLHLPSSVHRSVQLHQVSPQSRKRIRVIALDIDYVAYRLSRIVIWTGVFFAILGLSHQLLGIDSIFGLLPQPNTARRAYVPFANPNHLAVFLEMALFLSLGAFLFSLEEARSQADGGKQVGVAVVVAFLQRWKYGFSAAIIFVALIATVSRFGIALTFFGLALLGAFVLYERRFSFLQPVTHQRNAKSESPLTEQRLLLALKLGISFVFLATLVIGFLGESGRDTVTERFGAGVSEGIDGIRREFFSISFSAIPSYFFLGAGLGCWHFAVSPFADEALAAIRLDYAHNDLLQLFVETGVFGLLIASAFVFFVVRAFLTTWKNSGLYAERLTLLTSFLAVGLPLLHSLLDFPFHIPALALAYVAVLVALLRRLDGRI